MQSRPWRRLIVGQIVIAACGVIAILLGVNQFRTGTSDRGAWGLVVAGAILVAVASSLIIFALVTIRRLRNQSADADGGGVGE